MQHTREEQARYDLSDTDEREPEGIYSRYISLPIQVLSLLETKTISPREAILLGLVDGFCNHSKGLLCFASNRYLAKRLGCTPSQVQTMLGKLRKIGLIESINDVGGESRRQLRVGWGGP